MTKLIVGVHSASQALVAKRKGFKIAKLLPTGFQRKSRTGLWGLNFGRKGGGHRLK